jgi:N-acetylmuramoyl-L-alanine amidase
LPTARIVLTVCLAAALLFDFRSNASEFLVLQKQGRKTLPKVLVDQTAYLPIVEFLQLLDLPYSESVSAGYFQISAGKGEIRLNKDKAQVLVNGTPVGLSTPVIVAQNQWLAPTDFVERGLNRILPEAIGVSSSGDRFALGGVEFNNLSIRPAASEQSTRIAIQPGASVQPEIRQEESRVLVLFGAAAMDPGKERSQYQDERVRAIRFEPGETTDQLVIDLAEKNLTSRVTHLASQNIYLVEISRPEAAADAPPSGIVGQGRSVSFSGRWRHITVDAGHGGEDRGTVLGDNLFEKDVALAMARRVRWALQAKLNLEVALSRSEDRSISLDERALQANRAQSNLFVSIHLGNATQTQASRSYAYVADLPADPETALAAASSVRSLFVPWEMAQRNSLPGSQLLAECLQSEFNRTLNGGEASLVYRKAPLRLLYSLSMPAVLVEIGNVRQSDFLRKANDPQFQNRVAATVVAAVEKFRATQGRP